MARASGSHVGRPLAILIVGEVVMAPVIRSAIGASALISGFSPGPRPSASSPVSSAGN
jgi:preprotein translocase subunit SecD